MIETGNGWSKENWADSYLLKTWEDHNDMRPMQQQLRIDAYCKRGDKKLTLRNFILDHFFQPRSLSEIGRNLRIDLQFKYEYQNTL